MIRVNELEREHPPRKEKNDNAFTQAFYKSLSTQNPRKASLRQELKSGKDDDLSNFKAAEMRSSSSGKSFSLKDFRDDLEITASDGSGIWGISQNDINDPLINNSAGKFRVPKVLPRRQLLRAIRKKVPTYFDTETTQQQMELLKDPTFTPTKIIDLTNAKTNLKFLQAGISNMVRDQNELNVGISKQKLQHIDL